MLTATAEVPTTADGPGSAEPPWVWVSPGVGRTGVGRRGGPRGPASWPHPPQRDAPIATLVRRIQQLQNERAQAFRRLDQ